MSNYTNKTATGRDYYEAGRETGRKWMDDYRPGGPWCTRDSQRYPDSTRRDEENAKLWFMGFDKGLKRSPIHIYKRLTA